MVKNKKLPVGLKFFSQSGGADAIANERKDAILSNPNMALAEETVLKFYVSDSLGDDNNDGLSPETPFKTVAKVNEAVQKGKSNTERTAVLFKRGDTFRINSALLLRSNVTYTAYGKGKKPIISGSLKNYAVPYIWRSENEPNIWSTVITGFSPEEKVHLASNVVFNDGESFATRKETFNQLKNNGDYYFDRDTDTLYLYLFGINPGNSFSSIEIHTSNHLLELDVFDAENIIINNLSLKYAGRHAIVIIRAENLEISDCEIGWAGGLYIKRDGKYTQYRYGNSIEFWDKAVNCSVKRCYIYQSYDAAITFQGRETDLYKNLDFSDNLIEYSSFNFEYWTSWENKNARVENVRFCNNILRFAGCGFAGITRPDNRNQAFLLSQAYCPLDEVLIDILIKDNIFDCADSRFLFGTQGMVDRLKFENNTYYQKYGSRFSVRNDTDDAPPIDYDSFIAGIKTFDKNVLPENVFWLKN